MKSISDGILGYCILAIFLATPGLTAELKITKTEKVELNGVRDIEKITFKSPVDQAEDFALVKPPDKDTTSNRSDGLWCVYLHGGGSTGCQLFERFGKSIVPLLLERNLGILSPNYRGSFSYMCPEALEDTRILLDHVRKKYNAKKFLFIGGSMGGAAVLTYSSLHPEDVAACVALCPIVDFPSFIEGSVIYGPRVKDAYKNDAKALERHSALRNTDHLTMPVYVVHGEKDHTIPVDQPRRLKEKLAAKRDFVYVEIPWGDHETPCNTNHVETALKWGLDMAEKGPSR